MGFGGILKQSTAVNVIIGPFVDATDGDTEETGLTIAQADVRLSKNAGADAQKNDNTTCAHEGDGFYMCELDATDTNTCGLLTLWVHVAGALACRHDFQIIEEDIYASLFAASAAAFDASHNVTVGTMSTGVINRAAFAADTGLQSIRSNTAQAGAASTITLDTGASAVNDYYNGASILLTGGTGSGQFRIITDYVGATKVATVNSSWATNPDATTTFAMFPAAASVEEVAAAVWNAARASYTTAGSFGQGVASVQGAVTGAVGSVTGNVGGNVVGTVGSVVGAVGSVTGNVGGNVTGSVGSLAAQAKADVNAEVLDVLVTDTFAEPAAVPAATASLKDKIGWQAVLARNKITQTATTQLVRNDADSATIGTSAVSDDGVTATRGEFG